MAKIEWTEMTTPEEPELGPPKPPTCLGGPESHPWQLSIEEGQFTLVSDCQLCNDGLWSISEPEDWEMSPISVTVEFFHERTYDGDHTVYWCVTPVSPPPGVDQPERNT